MLNHRSLVNSLWCWGLVFTAFQLLILFESPGFAQIEPDNTLGTENSIVNDIDPLNKRIDGGLKLDGNLFHSFREFNVGENGSVYFANPQGVTDIFSRVTGGNPSNIFGKLGVLGDANLFLINPNGIVFGEKASLDVQGSFVATTANAIEFGERGSFSASNPETPQLLTVNPSALFFNAVNNQAQIVNRSRATSTVLGNTINGLGVVNGNSLLLVGGDVLLEGGIAQSPGGRVELGGLAEAGKVGLGIDGDILSLSYPVNATKANVILDNSAVINVDGDRAGSIHLEGNSVNLSGASAVDSQTGNQDSGEISIRAENLDITGNSRIASVTNGTGQSGNITIDTGNFTLQETSLIYAISFLALGKTGNIELLAKDSVNLINSFMSTLSLGANAGGTIFIEAKNFSLENGAGIATSVVDITNFPNTFSPEVIDLIDTRISTINPESLGKANSGNLTIVASDSVKISGESANGSRSFLTTGTLSTGSGGNLAINTRQMLVKDGGFISTGTSPDSQGKGGNLTVIATDSVELSGTNTNGIFPSGLRSSTEGSGDAGSLKVETEKLAIQGGAQIFTGAAFGSQGKGGNLTVIATDSIELSGTNENGEISSGLFSSTGGTKDAGSLKVETEKLAIQSGAIVSAGTLPNSQGKGGNLTVIADSIELSGTNQNGRTSSGLYSQTEGTGDAADLKIETGKLIVQDGAIVSVSTLSNSQGKGGNLTVIATDSIELSGTNENNNISSSLRSSTEGSGDAGSLKVETRKLTVGDGARITAETTNSGNAGNVLVKAKDLIEISGVSQIVGSSSRLTTAINQGATGNGSNLTVETSQLIVRDGGQVISSTLGEGNAGDLMVNADFIEIYGSTADAKSGLFAGAIQDSGDGGDLKIQTDKLTIRDEGTVSVSNFQSRNLAPPGSGSPGNLEINANSILLDNKGSITAATLQDSNKEKGNISINVSDILEAKDSTISTTSQQSSGGAINITAKDIRLFGNSDIVTNVFSGKGGGGDITLNANTIIALDDSDIFSFASDGEGGDITFNTEAFFSKPLYRPSTPTTDATALEALDNNNRVDVNASGTVSGNITGIPDTSFIQDSLTDLADNQIDTNTLIANSCVVRSNQQNGTFLITGSGGLPINPSDAPLSSYSTGSIRSIPNNSEKSPASTTRRKWKIGDPIIEPQGVYKLSNGQLVLSRECS